MNPPWEPIDPPYADPVRDQLDALEKSIERTFEPGPTFGLDPAGSMDTLGAALGAIEASIEGTVVPAPLSAAPDIFVPSPATTGPAAQGFISPGPQRLPESVERRWGDLQPPAAATLFFLSYGPKAPAYHPLGGSGTGIRNTDEPELPRWCPEANQSVNQENCRACSQWDDHGSGFHECRHDWLAENENKGREKDQDHEDEF